jgi:hypothetical protein
VTVVVLVMMVVVVRVAMVLVDVLSVPQGLSLLEVVWLSSGRGLIVGWGL